MAGSDSVARVVRMSNGAYLATTPDWHSHRIGVVGVDEQQARARFEGALREWERLAALVSPDS